MPVPGILSIRTPQSRPQHQWLELKGRHLLFFASQQDKLPLQTVDLYGLQLSLLNDYEFSLSGPNLGTQLKFTSTSASDRKQWMEAIKAAQNSKPKPTIIKSQNQPQTQLTTSPSPPVPLETLENEVADVKKRVEAVEKEWGVRSGNWTPPVADATVTNVMQLSNPPTRETHQTCPLCSRSVPSSTLGLHLNKCTFFKADGQDNQGPKINNDINVNKTSSSNFTTKGTRRTSPQHSPPVKTGYDKPWLRDKQAFQQNTEPLEKKEPRQKERSPVRVPREDHDDTGVPKWKQAHLSGLEAMRSAKANSSTSGKDVELKYQEDSNAELKRQKLEQRRAFAALRYLEAKSQQNHHGLEIPSNQEKKVEDETSSLCVNLSEAELELSRTEETQTDNEITTVVQPAVTIPLPPKEPPSPVISAKEVVEIGIQTIEQQTKVRNVETETIPTPPVERAITQTSTTSTSTSPPIEDTPVIHNPPTLVVPSVISLQSALPELQALIEFVDSIRSNVPRKPEEEHSLNRSLEIDPSLSVTSTPVPTVTPPPQPAAPPAPPGAYVTPQQTPSASYTNEHFQHPQTHLAPHMRHPFMLPPYEVGPYADQYWRMNYAGPYDSDGYYSGRPYWEGIPGHQRRGMEGSRGVREERYVDEEVRPKHRHKTRQTPPKHTYSAEDEDSPIMDVAPVARHNAPRPAPQRRDIRDRKDNPSSEDVEILDDSIPLASGAQQHSDQDYEDAHQDFRDVSSREVDHHTHTQVSQTQVDQRSTENHNGSHYEEDDYQASRDFASVEVDYPPTRDEIEELEGEEDNYADSRDIPSNYEQENYYGGDQEVNYRSLEYNNDEDFQAVQQENYSESYENEHLVETREETTPYEEAEIQSQASEPHIHYYEMDHHRAPSPETTQNYYFGGVAPHNNDISSHDHEDSINQPNEQIPAAEQEQSIEREEEPPRRATRVVVESPRCSDAGSIKSNKTPESTQVEVNTEYSRDDLDSNDTRSYSSVPISSGGYVDRDGSDYRGQNDEDDVVAYQMPPKPRNPFDLIPLPPPDPEPIPLEDVGPDNRIPCPVCQRRFAPNRIHKHASICGRLARVNWFEYYQHPPVEETLSAIPNPDDPVDVGDLSGRVACPHCGRRFHKGSAEAHVFNCPERIAHVHLEETYGQRPLVF